MPIEKLLWVIGAVAYVLVIASCFGRFGIRIRIRRQDGESDSAVLHRCRTNLRQTRIILFGIRHELERLPASRAVHQLSADVDAAEREVNQLEAQATP
ncbi:MAG TPA: hypothetical protein VHA06_07015 [Candidatus Angelobacter sp.]|jgi:hypothetical protein|nr:hypothetical protein [Candidatus Angelobacter sp.]